MSENTKIEWADASWSPWRGCTKVSAGCAHCYAETLSKRNPAVIGQWGKGKPRVLAKNWNDPVKWNKSGVCINCGFIQSRAGKQPHQTKGGSGVCGQPKDGRIVQTFRRPRVFTSLCDWLDDEVPIEWLARFLGLIQATPNIDWLLLTKRPENWFPRVRSALRYCNQRTDNHPRADACIRAMLADWLDDVAPPNVWIGTSVEDQANADRRIPALLKIPAKRRFLSVEPMLGPVDLGLSPSVRCRHCDNYVGGHATGGHDICDCRINWVIVGGESGPGARPCNLDWVRSVVRQCAASETACFVKQLGANPVGRWTASPDKAGLGEGWPADVRVRQMPEVKP